MKPLVGNLQVRWFRRGQLLLAVVVIALISLAFASPTLGVAAWQGDEAPVDVTGEVAKSEPPTILTMLFGGNALGIAIVGLILLLSIVSVYFIIEHLLTITRKKLMPDKVSVGTGSIDRTRRNQQSH